MIDLGTLVAVALGLRWMSNAFTFPTAWLCLLPYVLSWDCLGSFPIQATICYPMPARAMVST